MATTFKKFQPNDVTTTRTLLHESVPMTGTLMSGTYGVFPSDTNVKTYTHGMFESVYDYPYLSSSANHIFDLTVGFANSATSSLTELSTADKKKRRNIYNSMAQVLAGFQVDANLQQFDEDGDLTSGNKYTELFFINFSRLLYKDEIKKGSFQLDYYASGSYENPSNWIRVADYGATTDYRINSPAGDFGVLYVTQQAGSAITTVPAAPLNNMFARTGSNGLAFAGLIYYQAGIVALPVTGSGVNAFFSSGSIAGGRSMYSGSAFSGSLDDMIASGSVDDFANNFRHRVRNMQFNNTTELNSAVHFCRVNHNDFNYSSNKSYLSASKIRVKQDNTDTPVSYITTVGLYDANNNLMATAKLSEPIKKTPDTELVLRVRLDY